MGEGWEDGSGGDKESRKGGMGDGLGVGGDEGGDKVG